MTIMTDDKVGYKSPPKHAQFKSGNNANPRGRGARTHSKPREIVQRILNRLETVSVGGRNTKVTRLERVVRRFGNDALKGSVESALLLLDLRKHAEEIGDMRPIVLIVSEDGMRL
jgi:hypothetical protein